MIYWHTPDEPWHGLIPTYQAACDWATGRLGTGHDQTCLVIGSPLEEVRALACAGWHVTYFDWRVPPERCGAAMYQGDACAMPFVDAMFDAISSTCVLCHVGMGRYGDPVGEHAPYRMLKECARVLKPGGQLVMMVGPMAEAHCVLPQHRVVTIKQVAGWCEQAGLSWRGYQTQHGETEDYLCIACERP